MNPVEARETLDRLRGAWQGALSVLRAVVPDPCMEEVTDFAEEHGRRVTYTRVGSLVSGDGSLVVGGSSVVASMVLDDLPMPSEEERLQWRPRQEDHGLPLAGQFSSWANHEGKAHLMDTHLPMTCGYQRGHHALPDRYFAVPRAPFIAVLEAADQNMDYRATKAYTFGLRYCVRWCGVTLWLPDEDDGVRIQLPENLWHIYGDIKSLPERSFHVSGASRLRAALDFMLQIADRSDVHTLESFGERRALREFVK